MTRKFAARDLAPRNNFRSRIAIEPTYYAYMANKMIIVAFNRQSRDSHSFGGNVFVCTDKNIVEATMVREQNPRLKSRRRSKNFYIGAFFHHKNPLKINDVGKIRPNSLIKTAHFISRLLSDSSMKALTSFNPPRT